MIAAAKRGTHPSDTSKVNAAGDDTARLLGTLFERKDGVSYSSAGAAPST
jgi:hypothetical protein